jgi:hypothetical protein
MTARPTRPAADAVSVIIRLARAIGIATAVGRAHSPTTQEFAALGVHFMRPGHRRTAFEAAMSTATTTVQAGLATNGARA